MTDIIFDSAIYRPTVGFMGLPNRYDLAGARLAVLGMPFDCGVHPTRIGSRLGPAAIREQSGLVRPYQPPIADFNPLEEIRTRLPRYEIDPAGLVRIHSVNVRGFAAMPIEFARS